MKNSVFGILAHVDAGKTTLAEALLYKTGSIRKLGRVDHGDSLLDNFAMERARGITVFSKEARFSNREQRLCLLDTPGHTDFSCEMERTLSVLDFALLVISGTAGVQSHTLTVWNLLREYRVPTVIFVNKQDLPGKTREEHVSDLEALLSPACVPFAKGDEAIAMGDEALLEEYLTRGKLRREAIASAMWEERIFPVLFGSALRLEGIDSLLDCLAFFPGAGEEEARKPFGAKVYKITREDETLGRLSCVKITSGTLRVRDNIALGDAVEKVTGLYHREGNRLIACEAASAGELVMVRGLNLTSPGMSLGSEKAIRRRSIEPTMRFRLSDPALDAPSLYQRMRVLEEENPELSLLWDAEHASLEAALMGEVQKEILASLYAERFGGNLIFGEGNILYKETILAPVEGVGHYEPLRHYAEVHLLLEPAARGSGISFSSELSEDELGGNWQRLILTHIGEKIHHGVLIGAPLTDVTITLVAGRAHLKHTEGGDFREATYRAIRQGLMRARTVILEPWLKYRLTLPASCVGRGMQDLSMMGARAEDSVTVGENTCLQGIAPASAMQNYAAQVVAYSHGTGVLSLEPAGFYPVENPEKLVEEIGYDPEAAPGESPGSIFCAHGAGFYVPWNDVEKYMHLDYAWREKLPEPMPAEANLRAAVEYRARMASADDKELMRIFEKTYGPIKEKPRSSRPTVNRRELTYRGESRPSGPEYYLVDGYNVLFYEHPEDMTGGDLTALRDRFIDRMRNFQGFLNVPLILVFDAWKVHGGRGSVERHGDFSVVYTKEAETADMYIEKVTRELGHNHRVWVATSDGMEQIIILNHGALRMPASEFVTRVEEAEKAIARTLDAENRKNAFPIDGILPAGIKIENK